MEIEEWNIFWAGVWTIKSIFNPQTGHRLADNQLLNHFPNHYELTRKDLMVKNLRRFKKECRSSNHPLAEKDEFGNELFLDAIPTTYILPLDYPIFEEDFRKNPTTVWIAKPSGGAQGKGILIVSQLNQMKKWANYSKYIIPYIYYLFSLGSGFSNRCQFLIIILSQSMLIIHS